ncbi:MAG TPA: hypothetical protein VN715_21845 [Roseiarcus sp.]|nr:hypothetical protein [Roseiarcus sp.]
MGAEHTAALWAAVVASGLYHGANPGMGWPLAVSAAMFERRAGALLKALAALGVGHLLAMLVVLAPFSIIASLAALQIQIRLGAATLVIGLGVYLLLSNRHPRFLQRVAPHRLALWSFLVATAHGAALMLLPIYLGLCAVGAPDAAHAAAGQLMREGVLQAGLVALTHTLAMMAAGGVAAAAIYYWLGLRAISTVWINLDKLWAGSLIGVGAVAIALAV